MFSHWNTKYYFNFFCKFGLFIFTFFFGSLKLSLFSDNFGNQPAVFLFLIIFFWPLKFKSSFLIFSVNKHFVVFLSLYIIEIFFFLLIFECIRVLSELKCEKGLTQNSLSCSVERASWSLEVKVTGHDLGILNYV